MAWRLVWDPSGNWSAARLCVAGHRQVVQAAVSPSGLLRPGRSCRCRQRRPRQRVRLPGERAGRQQRLIAQLQLFRSCLSRSAAVYNFVQLIARLFNTLYTWKCDWHSVQLQPVRSRQRSCTQLPAVLSTCPTCMLQGAAHSFQSFVRQRTNGLAGLFNNWGAGSGWRLRVARAVLQHGIPQDCRVMTSSPTLLYSGTPFSPARTCDSFLFVF